jgi:hypothetical protein
MADFPRSNIGGKTVDAAPVPSVVPGTLAAPSLSTYAPARRLFVIVCRRNRRRNK